MSNVYYIFNKELGLFFAGFDNDIFTKYISKAKPFYDLGYANHYLYCYNDRFNGFSVYSFKQVSKVVLYA